MNIIIEGPDNAGKTTLANAIHKATGWPIKSKEGKTETFSEMLKKINKYLNKIPRRGMIIDRHPMISQPIYGSIVRDEPCLPDHLFRHFISQCHLIIYARCTHIGMSGHEASPTDTPDHLVKIEKHAGRILQAYDDWAIHHADIIYSRWDQLPMIVKLCKGAVA